MNGYMKLNWLDLTLIDSKQRLHYIKIIHLTVTQK